MKSLKSTRSIYNGINQNIKSSGLHIIYENSHFSLFITQEISYFIDPLGQHDLKHVNCVKLPWPVQSYSSGLCGAYVIYFADKLCQGYSLENAMNMFSRRRFISYDIRVLKYLETELDIHINDFVGNGLLSSIKCFSVYLHGCLHFSIMCRSAFPYNQASH